MKISAYLYLLRATGLAAATGIAGCAGTQTLAPQQAPLAVRQAASGDSVYAGGEFKIGIATYPGLKAITHFSFQGGETLCSDASGNVFVVETGRMPAYVHEYRHGARTAFAKLSVPQPFAASGCSVDPATNNLAVSLAQVSYDSSGGGVAIYKHESGAPKVYTYSQISQSRDVVYDDSGDLFVIALPPQHSGYGGEPIFAELPKGSQTFTTITGIPSYDLYYFTGMQWDGKYVDLQYAYAIAQFGVNGSSGRVADWIQLNSPIGSLDTGPGALWLDRANSQIVMPVDHRRSLAIFAYPQGGEPVKVSPDLHQGHLYSVTISAAH